MLKFLRSLAIIPLILLAAACHNNAGSSSTPSTVANPSSTLVTVTTKN